MGIGVVNEIGSISFIPEDGGEGGDGKDVNIVSGDDSNIVVEKTDDGNTITFKVNAYYV